MMFFCNIACSAIAPKPKPDMKYLNWLLTSLAVIAFSGVLFAQSIKIKVMDNRDGKVLPGVLAEPLCANSSATTNNAGEASLSLAQNNCCDVKISKAGYADHLVSVCPGGGATEIYLNRQLAIRGTLKDNSGKPLNRARIILTNSCGDGKRVAYTDAIGQFTLNPLAIENCCYKLEVKHYDYPKNVSTFCTNKQVSTEDIRLNIPISSEPVQQEVAVSYTPRTVTPTVTTPTIYTPPATVYTPPTHQHTNTPTHQHPNTPTHQHPNTPTHQHTNTPTHQHPNTPTHQHPNTPTHQHTNTIITESAYINPIDVSTMTTPFTFNFTYFDYNKADIRPDAYASLDNIIAIMKGNADVVVEVSGHSDAQGTDAYNKSLSKRRASAVVDYLVTKGIDRNRLIPVGYGEEQLINHCANNVACSDAEHQQNRRSQYQVKGSVYDAQYSRNIESSNYELTPSTTPTTIPTSIPAPTPKPAPSAPASTEPIKVPCPDCPIKELDSEEYFDDNFYDQKEYEDGEN